MERSWRRRWVGGAVEEVAATRFAGGRREGLPLPLVVDATDDSGESAPLIRRASSSLRRPSHCYSSAVAASAPRMPSAAFDRCGSLDAPFSLQPWTTDNRLDLHGRPPLRSSKNPPAAATDVAEEGTITHGELRRAGQAARDGSWFEDDSEVPLDRQRVMNPT